TDSSQLTDEQFLCSRCGYIADTNKLLCKHCSKNEKRFSREWISVRQVKPSNGYIVKVCPACGGQKHVGGSIIRPFSPGDDAAGTVLAHSLMTEIPETSETQILAVKESNKPKSRFTSRTKTKTFLKTAGKKRLLAFSDSRQDAAYFATFLDRTANHILHRQFIIQAAKKLLKDNPGIDVFGPADLKNPLIEIAQKNGLFDISFTELEKSNEVFKWINSELIGIQKRNGLEGVGLLTWDLKYRNQLIEFLKKHDEGIFEDYKLHAEEFIKLLEIILSELRKQNVLQALPNVDIRDSYFWPRNRPYSIRETSVNPALSISAWTPQSARKNIRSDYIQKLYKKLDVKIDNEFVKKLLSDLWDLTNEFEDGIIWEEIPSVNTLWGGRGNDGTVWQLKNNSWVGRLHSNKIYKCNLCGNYSSLSLKHICPVYNCSGELTKIIPEHEFKDNHYRNTYEGASVPISVLEHTAQLTNQEGAERQRNFTNDKNNLNILSCSTTFELGVDVGELHAVFLRNVPPTVSNYIQRSGRAGRRLSAAAFVLTFCRTRPHDLGYFDMVNKLIAGKIKPSLVTIDNSRIARRHLHAVVLSHFWRHNYPRLFNGPENKKKGIVKWMFFETDKTVSQLVYDWLAQKPEELIEELIRIFPEEIFNKIGLDNWGWVSKLIDFSKNEDSVWEGSLGLAQSELTNEYNEYEKLGKETPRLFNYAASQQKRITERQSLGFLASRNVLPKYGFPVDVVSLKIQSKDNWAQRIELDRDLKLALGEYAPGCTLVANGKVIKSYALEKIAGRQWPEYQFIICKECGRFYRTSTSHGDKIEICDCGNSLLEKSNTLLEGNFIIPYLGFRTKIDEDGQDPVEIRPQRTFPTRVYFSHYETTFMNKFIHEGDPDPLSGYRIKKRYSRDGTLAVLNPGRSNRGFWVCPSCGFGDSVAEGQPKKHKTP
ncbi:MAG: helicase-related protein, partial [Thermodesulfobacteriota bacterium]|nr:helicase-related protein [Thermodesulfobacteriota bacterium]